MNDHQLEVLTWWYGRRDYSSGIALLSRYCKNRTIVQTLNKPGKEKFINSVQKLHYEVTKAVHLDWLHMPKDTSPDFLPVEDIPSENPPWKLIQEEKTTRSRIETEVSQLKDKINILPAPPEIVVKTLKEKEEAIVKAEAKSQELELQAEEQSSLFKQEKRGLKDKIETIKKEKLL